MNIFPHMQVTGEVFIAQHNKALNLDTGLTFVCDASGMQVV